jgi:hypothetical protein
MLSRVWMHIVQILWFYMLITTTPAVACSTLEPISDAQLFARASSVFVAHVFRTEETTGKSPLPGGSEVLVEANFRVVETLKGRPPTDGKVRSFVWGPGNCNVFLIAGFDYLFFIGDDTFVLSLDGSRIITLKGYKDVVRKTEDLLESLRVLSRQAK